MSIIFIIISHVIIFLTGLFLGRFFEDYFISKYKYKNKNDNQNIPDQNQKTITAYFHKKFQVIKNNSQPINKNDISINLQNQKKRTKTKNPNFIALTILWSHFQACRKNMIGKNITSPWQKYEKGNTLTLEEKKWRQFLETIIHDKSWTGWINNPQEVKKRSLNAYKKIENKDIK